MWAVAETANPMFWTSKDMRDNYPFAIYKPHTPFFVAKTKEEAEALCKHLNEGGKPPSIDDVPEWTAKELKEMAAEQRRSKKK